jgi:hypothetical protein
MLRQVYSYEILSKTTYKWYKCFHSGRTSTVDDRSGQPSSSRNRTLLSQVKEVIQGNRHLTVQEVAEKTGISVSSCYVIVTEDIGMCQVSAKFVPRLLTEDQRIDMFLFAKVSCNERMRMNIFFTTIDRTWFYGYDKTK